MSEETQVNGGGQLIKTEETAISLPAVALFKPYEREGGVLCSVDMTTEQGFVAFMTMAHGEQEPIANVIGQELSLVNFFVKAVQGTDELTGEVTIYPRTCLECSDGKIYSCGSGGVFASLADLLRWRSKAPWSPPMRVKVLAKNIGKGKRYFVLMPVFLPPNAEAPKGGKGRG